MDMKALAEKLSRLQDSGKSGSKTWFKLTEEEQLIRILPYQHQPKNDSFIEVFFHYDVGGHKSIPCPEATPGVEGSCPICKLAEEFRTMGGKDNWYIFRDMQAKIRAYSPVIVRGKEEEGVKLYGYGKTIYEDLMSTSIEEGDITNIAEGHDLKVWKVLAGAPGNDTTFDQPNCKVQFKQTPAMTNTKTLKKLIKEIPNYIEDESLFNFMDYQQLCDVVEKLKTGESEETDYGSEEVVTVSEDSTTVAESSDDLKSQLDNLLED